MSDKGLIRDDSGKSPGKLTAHEIGVLKVSQNSDNRDLTYDEADDATQISILSSRPHVLIRSKERHVTIGKKEYPMDVYALCGMIRRITSQIGSYNENPNDPYAAYLLIGLRKVRADMASALEANFGVHFHVDESGKSLFYMG